ncbi:MAG: DUF6596 domain-containing protein [Myxococcota bacterium]
MLGPRTPDPRQTVEQVVRAHGPRVLSGLVSYFGGGRTGFGLAEDAWQDALAVALETWPVAGVPANPSGWLVVTARRKALDRIRRRAVRADKHGELEVEARLAHDDAAGDVPDIPDERLALVFTCCHPALSEEARVALTLRTMCGLSTPELARCFMLPEPTVQQRIVRAKRKIEEARIPYRVPERAELPERLSSVLAVVYLVFNEGYAATAGELLRVDLCEEALRLGALLVELLPDEPEAHGLLALMALHHARRGSRVDADGVLVTLEEQDRSTWDRVAIDQADERLRAALARRAIGPYQVQAAIAAVHARAVRPEDTDWWQIVGLYAALHALAPTPVVALNAAAALAMAAGPEVGLERLADPSIAGPLAEYHLLHAARADLCRRLGQLDQAREHYRAALARATNEAERRYLRRRLEQG